MLVHAVFFSLLYFSFNWHVNTPSSIEVEMWTYLPHKVSKISHATPPVKISAVHKSKVILPTKKFELTPPKSPDIKFKEKESKQNISLSSPKIAVATEPKEPEDKIQNEAGKQHTQALLNDEQKLATQKMLDKIRADTEAANRDEVTRYTDLIRNKIKRNIVLPPNLQDNAEAEFMVTVLPGGSVMNDGVKLLKSSGNAAYDSSAERAIYKAQPLPLPQDASLARVFRELHLTVKPYN